MVPRVNCTRNAGGLLSHIHFLSVFFSDEMLSAECPLVALATCKKKEISLVGLRLLVIKRHGQWGVIRYLRCTEGRKCESTDFV